MRIVTRETSVGHGFGFARSFLGFRSSWVSAVGHCFCSWPLVSVALVAVLVWFRVHGLGTMRLGTDVAPGAFGVALVWLLLLCYCSVYSRSLLAACRRFVRSGAVSLPLVWLLGPT